MQPAYCLLSLCDSRLTVLSLLQAASWEDASTLPFLAHTLRLLATVRDLAAANKALRELWVKRKDASLAFVFDLFMSESDRSPSVPLATCRDLIVDLMDELQPSGIAGDKLAKVRSLSTPSSFGQSNGILTFRLCPPAFHPPQLPILRSAEHCSPASAGGHPPSDGRSRCQGCH